MSESIKRFSRKWSILYRKSSRQLDKISILKELRKELDKEARRWDELYKTLENLQNERVIKESYSSAYEALRSTTRYRDDDGEISRISKILEGEEKTLSGEAKYFYKKALVYKLIDGSTNYDLSNVNEAYSFSRWRRNLINDLNVNIDDLETAYEHLLRSEGSDAKVISLHFMNTVIIFLKGVLKILYSIWREIKSLDRWVLMILILAVLSAFGIVQLQESIAKLIERL